jgi:DNA polymerase III sliding clamp (beta) subunit (PCNA family)
MKKSEFIEGGIQKIEGIMVSKNSPAWEKFRFISGAKSKDTTRFSMMGIHIEQAGNKTFLVSTDGRRMHIATMDTLKIESGDYEVKENTRDFMILYPRNEEDVNYPNWKKIVQQQKAKKHAQIEISNNGKQEFSKSLFSLYKATDKLFNCEYIEALAAVASVRYDTTQKYL